jgi:Skp family chaperone for outer membrane proteins
MRYFAAFMLSVTMVTVMFCGSNAALAQTKIAVVSFNKVISESRAAESIQKQVQKNRKDFDDDFSKIERALVEKEKSLVESRASEDAQEFAEKRKAFEEQVLESRRMVQESQQSLEQAANRAMLTLRDEITKIASVIADRESYDIVLTRQNVMLAKPEFDITDEVISVLNKEIKDIKLEVKSK